MSSAKPWQEEYLFSANPDPDPEDEDIGNDREFFNASKHDLEREENLAEEPSRLLIKNAVLPSVKRGQYAGKLSSRSKLQEDSSADEEDESDVDDFDGEESDDIDMSDVGSSDKSEDLGDDDDEYEEEEEEDSDEDEVDSDESDGDEKSMSSKKQRSSDAPFASDGVQSVTVESASDDANKGKAIQVQVGLWESLLEVRIQLQPILLASNRLPTHRKMPTFCQNAEDKSRVGAAKAGVREMLSSMISLQHQLLDKNSETRHLAAIATTAASSASSRRTALKRDPQPSVDSDEEIDSDLASGDDEDGLDDADGGNDDMMQMLEKGKIGGDGSDSEDEQDEDTGDLGSDDGDVPSHGAKKRRKSQKSQTLKTSDEFEAVLSDFHHGFETYRNKVVTKWSDRTRLGSGKLTTKSFKSSDTSVVNAINQVLMDPDRLLKRTQLNRSNQLPIGEDQQPAETNSEGSTRDSHLKSLNPEIFDDEDFYHQMLKEFIEGQARVKDANDSVAMGRQWLQIQKLRRKVKKQVDTKASKGRKIRYDIHPKLVSFDAPVPLLSVDDGERDGTLAVIFGKRRHTG
ncbi:protein AATF-like isoform X2 [Sycon ciliatum]|uniref:protein AATF-like isoform X2 n=1 Tax=Sycon ciliatum TaxID=27933 RepID=UPI0031F709DC